MNETRKYLDHLTRETADTVTGKILARMPDGTYLYEDVATGARRFLTPNLRDEFAIGSRVRVDRPSASRTVIGSQDVAVTRAPREQRGLSGTTPSIDRDSYDRAVIISVDPDPLILTAGGEGGTQTITGRGFAAAATYVSRSEGEPDPSVTDEDDPEVSATEIVMHISADADSNTGDFAVKVSGAVASGALRIVQSRRVKTLWYWRTNLTEFVEVNPLTGAVLNSWPAPGGTNAYHSITADADYVYAFTSTHLLRVRLSDRVAQAFALSFTPTFWPSAVSVGGKLFVGEKRPASGTRPMRIVRADLDGQNAETIQISSDEAVYLYGLQAIGETVYGVAQVGVDSGRVFSLNTSTLGATVGGVIGDFLADPNFALAGDYLALFGTTAGNVTAMRRHSRADLSFSADIEIGDTREFYVAVGGPTIYLATRGTANVPTLFVIDINTMSVAPITLPALTIPAGVVVDAEYIYVGNDGAAIIQLINRSTLALSTLDAPACRGMMLLA